MNSGEFFHLLAIPSKDRLLRVLRYMLDEKEFLSEFGIRSLSKVRVKVQTVLDYCCDNTSCDRFAFSPCACRFMRVSHSQWM